MKTNRKFQISVMVAMVAILLSSFASHVSAAQPSENGGVAKPAAASDCYQVIKDAEATLAGIDIPKTRAEYAALDRIAKCLVVADVSITIPSTGPSTSTLDRFMTVKDLQAEQADRSGYTQRVVTAAGYQDADFIEFKIRQAERMSQ